MTEDTGKRGSLGETAKAGAIGGTEGLKRRNIIGKIGPLTFLRQCHLVAFRGAYLRSA